MTAVAFGPSRPCGVTVNCHRDAARGRRHPCDWYRFWTLASRSRVKSVNSHRGREGSGARSAELSSPWQVLKEGHASGPETKIS